MFLMYIHTKAPSRENRVIIIIRLIVKVDALRSVSDQSCCAVKRVHDFSSRKFTL